MNSSVCVHVCKCVFMHVQYDHMYGNQVRPRGGVGGEGIFYDSLRNTGGVKTEMLLVVK